MKISLRRRILKLRKYLGNIWLATLAITFVGLILGFFVTPIAQQVANIVIACFFVFCLLVSETRFEGFLSLLCLTLVVLGIVF